MTSQAPLHTAPPRNGPRHSWTGWIFTGPFMAVFAFTLVVPLVYAAYLSLFRNQLIGGNSFVGLANYGQALADPRFWSSVERVSLLLAVQVPVMLLLGLGPPLAVGHAPLRGAPPY